jgi:uncharacterized protein YacL
MEATSRTNDHETAVMDQAEDSSEQQEADSWSDKVKAIGGLIAVAIGVTIVGIIAIVAMIKNTPTAATIASAAGGVIATIVGAYFGVKVGSDQAKNALEGQRREVAKSQKRQQAEAAKAQIYAMHLPPEKAEDVIQLAEKAAEDVFKR